MALPPRSQNMPLDLQELYACGADCGGPMADAWLAWRQSASAAQTQGTVYAQVRRAQARLGRRVRPEDLGAPAPSAPSALGRSRQRVAEVPTLPPGPAPLAVTARRCPSPPAAELRPAPVATIVAARGKGTPAARAGRSGTPRPGRTATTTRSRRARAARTRTRRRARRLVALALVRLLLERWR